EGICIEVVLERRLLGNLILFDSELLGQDFLDPLEDLFTRRCHDTSMLSVGGGKTGRSYTYPLRKPIREPLDDAVLDPASGQPDRVLDRTAAARAVRDHGEPPEPEQVGATVGVGVEPRAKPARRGSDQR